ncbi:MAG: hypothetical protein WCP36_09395 [Methanomicrobiales archaeon]
MASLNDDAQWLVLLGLIVCIGMFSLAVIINESVLVGQTTAESVLDFSKSDIQGLRGEVLRTVESDQVNGPGNLNVGTPEIEKLYLLRKHAIVTIKQDDGVITPDLLYILVHYNNGVTNYYETMVFVKP